MSVSERPGQARPANDPAVPLEPDSSLGELLGRITTDFGELVSTQVELAKVEIKEEVAKAGRGAAMLSGAAVASMLALVGLTFAAAWGLAEVMPTGWAFLIVAVVWAAIAGVLALTGRARLREVNAVPETRESIKEDVEWAQQQKI